MRDEGDMRDERATRDDADERPESERMTAGGPEQRRRLRFWKKNTDRASLTPKETALLGQYTQVSYVSELPFRTGRAPQPHPVAAEVPQPTHYWYEESEHPVTGKGEAEGGTTSRPTG